MGPDGDGTFQTPVRFGAGAYLTSCRGPGTVCRGPREEIGISSFFIGHWKNEPTLNCFPELAWEFMGRPDHVFNLRAGARLPDDP